MTKPKTTIKVKTKTPKAAKPTKVEKPNQAPEHKVADDGAQIPVVDAASVEEAKKGDDSTQVSDAPPVVDDDGQRGVNPTKPSTSVGITEGKVQLIPLAKMDLEDTTFRFRADLRVGPLVESIKAQGIQIPVVLRSLMKGKYQIISGFRRIIAAREAGLDAVPAIIRDLSDEAAFKASVLENTNRKTYSDIDRALVLQAHRDRGLGDDGAVVTLLKLTPRQQQHILSLLTLPVVAQEAIDDPAQHFSATHGLVLRQLSGKYPDLDWGKWVKEVNDGKLSIRDLRTMVNKEHGSKGTTKAFTGIFREAGTDAGKGVFHFSPVKVVVGEMTVEEKVTLKAELQLLLATLV
jgi:ParB/RepB/Spo0J family partition protein